MVGLMEAISTRATPQELIDRANEVPVFDVLDDWFGLHLPREGRSYKSRCPFGWEHPDGGVVKAWRTYPSTNSTFCFVMHGYMGSVRLVALLEGVKPSRAARLILDRYDLMKPRPWRERMREMQVAREQRETVGSTVFVVEALHAGLRDLDGYSEVQFRPVFTEALEEELERLDGVIRSGVGDVPARVREWYAEAKARLMEIMERNSGNGG